MAVTKNSGVGRTAPAVKTNGAGAVSIDDDKSKTPDVIVGFTTQAMCVANAAATATPNNMIV